MPWPTEALLCPRHTLPLHPPPQAAHSAASAVLLLNTVIKRRAEAGKTGEQDHPIFVPLWDKQVLIGEISLDDGTESFRVLDARDWHVRVRHR